MLHAQLPKALVVPSNTEACDDGSDMSASKCLFDQCHVGLREEEYEDADKEEMKRRITL